MATDILKGRNDFTFRVKLTLLELFDTEHGGNTLLWNVGKYLSVDIPRRLESSATSLWAGALTEFFIGEAEPEVTYFCVWFETLL
jgi:hypothetical protein